MVTRWSVVSGLVLGLVGCTQAEDDGGGGASIEVVAAELERSIDAARTPDGGATFFLGDDGDGVGVFEAVAGAAPRRVSAALTEATSLVITSDGASAVVAAALGGERGLVRVDLASGALEELAGVAGLAPRGLDLVRGDAGDTVIFSGADAEGPGVFAFDLGGDATRRLASIPAAGLLDGVAQAADGGLFVADRGGSIWHAVEGAAAEEVLADVTPGEPAGIALTQDESTLLVSSLSAAGTSQVVLLDTATFATSIFDDEIGANAASGGVHRALDANVFAWAGATKPKPAEGGGLVYEIGL